jgi:hypothetical protein
MTCRPLFRSRRFGWGWRPASWQGWLLAIATVVVVATVGFVFQADILGIVIVLTYLATLAVILFLRGGPGT